MDILKIPELFSRFMFFFESLLQQSNKKCSLFLSVSHIHTFLWFFTLQSMMNHECNTKSYKQVLFFNLLHLHLFLHDMFLKILTIFMQEFVLSFSGSQPSASHAAVISIVTTFFKEYMLCNSCYPSETSWHLLMHNNILLFYTKIFCWYTTTFCWYK